MQSTPPACDDKPALPLWLLGLTAAAMLLLLYLVFEWVSTERTMGIVQRIFYFHVPAAAVAFVACFVGGTASIAYLVTRDSRYDDLSLAANESVVVFEAVNIVRGRYGPGPFGASGGRGTRGLSSFFLLLINAANLIVRQAAPVEQRGATCAWRTCLLFTSLIDHILFTFDHANRPDPNAQPDRFPRRERRARLYLH